MDEAGYGPPPTILAGLLALQVAYLLCVGPFRNRFRHAQAVGTGKQLLFAQGVVVLFLALASPLHELSDRYLFTAHMVQHMLVTLVAAPLLLAGTPGWLLRELLDATRLTRVAVTFRHPLLAFGVFNVIFSLAHVPALYELALASPAIHSAAHVLFLISAMVMWMPILSPLPDLLPPYPPLGQVLYLFLQTVPASLVGAILSATNVAFYPTYIMAPRITSLSAVDDQELGGLLMWVGGGTFFLLATAVVFFAWANREEAANRRPVGGLQPSER